MRSSPALWLFFVGSGLFYAGLLALPLLVPPLPRGDIAFLLCFFILVGGINVIFHRRFGSKFSDQGARSKIGWVSTFWKGVPLRIVQLTYFGALLVYYMGAYGPTIRIAIQTPEDLIAMRRLFEKLASGEVVQQDLAKVLTWSFDSIQSLIVRSAPESPTKALELKGHTSQGPIFWWTNSYDDWLECAYKVDPLIFGDSPGHQYLTHEGFDDALVELCYKE